MQNLTVTIEVNCPESDDDRRAYPERLVFNDQIKRQNRN
jgi:hypothetical protein